ncbi:uncharacterized protein LOC120000671 [Tripterygium wilfordii]|uniref:uncharacterized protein LOC120000671 n=1 Tax=Tripterygium wilfordii TaxID=458696 RepID=UPI0018F83B86|nr:uncharacterized protein LOC120000671 [Tripterygium wilfordii]
MELQTKVWSKANFDEFTSDQEEKLFYATQSGTSHNTNVCYLDSGCSNHMFGNKDFFYFIQFGVSSNIRLGNGEVVESKGKGRVKIITDGGMKFINNVLFVPSLRHNLLSVGHMIENGYKLVFKGSGYLIYERECDENELMFIQIKNHMNFMVDFKSEELMALKNDFVKDGDAQLWHRRFCHLNCVDLKQLQQKEMIVSLPPITDSVGVCEECIKGK